MSINCTHCQKMHRTQVALDAVARGKIEGLEQKVTRLQAEVEQLQKLVRSASDLVGYLPEAHCHPRTPQHYYRYEDTVKPSLWCYQEKVAEYFNSREANQ